MTDIKLVNREQLDGLAQAWSGSIEQLSHALSTKIATLQLKQQGLRKVIPSLLKGYRFAVEHHLMEDDINEKTLRRLDDIQNLDEQLLPMFDLLKRFNDYNDLIVHYDVKDIPKLSAQQCLSEFMGHYCFEQELQKNLITLDFSQEFEFNCPFLFIETSFCHLLTAAFKRIKEVGKGHIQIWLSDEGEYNAFNIKDTSRGLTHDQQTNLFSHFLFEPYDKTRPGLGFCRLAIQHFNGDIIYDAVDDDSGCFKIIFLKLKTPYYN